MTSDRHLPTLIEKRRIARDGLGTVLKPEVAILSDIPLRPAASPPGALFFLIPDIFMPASLCVIPDSAPNTPPGRPSIHELECPVKSA